jgi:hypothetical protein
MAHIVTNHCVLMCNVLMPRLALQLFFPQIFDIKYLMKFCDNLHGGLNKLAETLDVARIGPQHQVGYELCFPLQPPVTRHMPLWLAQ